LITREWFTTTGCWQCSEVNGYWLIVIGSGRVKCREGYFLVYSNVWI